MQRIDAHLGGVRWAGELRGRPPGPLGVHDRGLDRRVRHLARRARAQGGGGAARPRRRAVRGRRCSCRPPSERPTSQTTGRLSSTRSTTLSTTPPSPRRPSTTSRSAPSCSPPSSAIETRARRGRRSSSRSPIEVDRERARFGAWYELFPRSWGGLRASSSQLPQLAELGFDVIYLPPIHPIGHTNRKGRNNALTAGPTDPGSPWAIGDETRRPRRGPPRARHDR